MTVKPKVGWGKRRGGGNVVDSSVATKRNGWGGVVKGQNSKKN